MEKMLLIDGSSLLFRAFYAIRELQTSDGIHTNGVYGFLAMFYKAIEMVDPKYVCVAFDRSGPTFRTKDYEQYKAHREETPSELSSQFGILKDVLDQMGITHLDMDRYEADDICGTLAKHFANDDCEVLLLTGDRDYLQLVDDHIKVLLTKKGISEIETYDLLRIEEEYGIKPLQFIDVKGFMGDTSDNIPGIPGVGEKTALKLIRAYGSMDEVYKNLEQISGKSLLQKLTDYEAQARMSRSLGEIFLEVPISLDSKDYQIQEPNIEGLRDRFERLQFRGFESKLPQKEQEEARYIETEWIEESRWKKTAMELLEESKIFIKIFHDHDRAVDGTPQLVAIQTSSDVVYLMDVRNTWEEFTRVFGAVLEKKALSKISFDVKDDVYLALKNGISYRGYEDGMLLVYLLDPSLGNYTLEKVSERILGKTFLRQEEVFGKGKSKKGWFEIERESLETYIAEWMMTSREVYEKAIVEVEEKEMLLLYREIERPLVEVLASMEFYGFKVDPEVLIEQKKQLEERQQQRIHAIYEYAGETFNINSTKQLSVILFEKLELQPIKKTKTGYSTDVEVLEKLRTEHPMIEDILAYRSISKLISTYIDGLLPMIDVDGRIRSTFRQNVAATGRLSSTDPNLQNIPVKTADGREIRKAFVAESGMTLIDADYSQIELRVLAHLSQDENMIQAFNENQDIHTKTAMEVFHTGSLEEVTPIQRSRAKAVNFGIVYGISDYGLTRDLGISRKEAKEYIQNYLDSYPGIQDYMQSVVEQGKKDGYVTTIFHRIRYIPELSSKNHNIRSAGERIALNTPIQGSAADIIKVAMLRVARALDERGLKSKLILQVHDELIVEAPDDEVEEVKQLLKETMQEAVHLSVELLVDIHSGHSWYESK